MIFKVGQYLHKCKLGRPNEILQMTWKLWEKKIIL